MDTSLSPEERAELLVAELTLEEKATLLLQSGGPGLPQYGVPPIRGKDGCCGVATTDTPSTALPVGVALASTFNLEAAEAYGTVTGSEARYFGFNGQAGPTLDLLTTPLNGRMWEAFGEDPLVSGSVAASQVMGTQSQEVYTIPKHYNLNNQETRRGNVDAVIEERPLQEVYTRPWEKVVRDAGHRCGDVLLQQGQRRVRLRQRRAAEHDPQGSARFRGLRIDATSTPPTRSPTTKPVSTCRVRAWSTRGTIWSRPSRTDSSQRSA